MRLSSPGPFPNLVLEGSKRALPSYLIILPAPMHNVKTSCHGHLAQGQESTCLVTQAAWPHPQRPGLLSHDPQGFASPPHRGPSVSCPQHTPRSRQGIGASSRHGLDWVKLPGQWGMVVQDTAQVSPLAFPGSWFATSHQCNLRQLAQHLCAPLSSGG